jgi:exodeoxyribonuclease-3
MRIATWNVNSVKARRERLLAWLARTRPDVACLQELKVEDGAFPHDDVRAAGYHAVVHGQRAYNGVAILSREEATDVQVGLADGVDDPQARLLSARVGAVRVLSVYVPNGGEPGSDKFRYKLEWLARLERYLRARCDPAAPLALCGDLNVAPDALDVARPEAWNDTVLCLPEVRAGFARLLAWGLVDCFRAQHPEGGHYSWWDYRMLGFPKNNGLRIDHVVATAPLASRCRAATIDRDERKGTLPSDHAPVVVDFADD